MPDAYPGGPEGELEYGVPPVCRWGDQLVRTAGGQRLPLAKATSLIRGAVLLYRIRYGAVGGDCCLAKFQERQTKGTGRLSECAEAGVYANDSGDLQSGRYSI